MSSVDNLDLSWIRRDDARTTVAGRSRGDAEREENVGGGEVRNDEAEGFVGGGDKFKEVQVGNVGRCERRAGI